MKLVFQLNSNALLLPTYVVVWRRGGGVCCDHVACDAAWRTRTWDAGDRSGAGGSHEYNDIHVWARR